MSKTVKNILMGFTLLCAVILLIFVIELIVINRGAGDKAGRQQSPPANTSSAASSTAGNSTGDDDAAGGVNSGGGGLLGKNENPPKGTVSQPAGTKHEMQVYTGKLLVWYVDEELFERQVMPSLDEVYSYIGDGEASLTICSIDIRNGAEECAETYLDVFLDGEESHVGGEGMIRKSSLNGVFVSGVNSDGETFEAWIHDGADEGNFGDIGVAFMIRYRDDEEKNALYDILDTLSIVAV